MDASPDIGALQDVSEVAEQPVAHIGTGTGDATQCQAKSHARGGLLQPLASAREQIGRE